VMPGGVDDPSAPSGGNTYDRRVCAGLAASGRPVRPVAVAGEWPSPGPAALDRLDAVLSALPRGSTVLLDGIVACAAPHVVVPWAQRLRVVVLVHLPLADETGNEASVAAGLDKSERCVLRAAAAVVATSSAVADRLVRHHGLDAARVVVVPPGVDPASPTVAMEGGTRLVCVASVIPRKGHDVLVEALSRVADLEWTCVCAGPLDRDPAYADLVRRRVAEHGLEPRVRFPGPLAADDVAALYACADLLVLGSRAEPYGMVVTEALARAIPVLATDVDGVPEALATTPDAIVPGMLVPVGDPAALAAATRRFRLTDWADTTAAFAAVLDTLGRAA
jgi:glycosyltransferase involved in cell wall biosynthesis